MNEQNKNAIVPMDGFSDSDPTASPLRGVGIRFKDGNYFSFSEKLNVTGKSYAVIDKRVGWQKLQRDCPPMYLMREAGQPMPPRPEVPKADWPLNLNGEPEHPWKQTFYLSLIDTTTGELSTLWTNTTGGKIGVGNLTDQVDFMRKHRPDAIPVIGLQSADMPTQYGGTKPRPHFQILGWKSAGPQLITDESSKLVDVEKPSLKEEMGGDEVPEKDWEAKGDPLPADLSAKATPKKKKK